MTTLQIDDVIKNRKSKFVHFRWLLFIWLGAVAAINAGTRTELASSVYGLFGAFILSQALLWALPIKYYDGMRVLNAIFILDLNFVLLGFGLSKQLQPELLMTLFLGTFMAALSKNMVQSIGTTIVIISVYLSFKLRTPDGFNFNQPQQLLQLPFLFISSMHSSLLAHEASSELEARKTIQSDQRLMSRHMNSTFTEIAHYCKDMTALVDALPFGAVMVDAHSKVRICNDIAEEVLGIDAAAAIAHNLDEDPRLAKLRPFLLKAASEPLLDFQEVEIPGDQGASWTMNLGVYPIREGEENRGLLIILIPQGYGDALKDAMPRPVLLPSEAAPALAGLRLGPGFGETAIPGFSLTELGLNYG